jgi:photosystem II stability/assembly factor-like uncharacterized protein
MLLNLFLIIPARIATLAAAVWMPLYCQSAVSSAISVTVVRVDPHHRGTVLAGTATALLFRSRDGAATWTPLPFPVELRATLHAILIDPAKPNVYLVAASSEIPLHAGVFRSVDEGATWEQEPGLRKKQVWSLASWAADAHVIAAGAQDGVFLTRDGGKTWTRISPPGQVAPQPVVALAFDPVDSNILYAGTPHLAWKTTNGGAKWRSIHKGMQEDSDVFSIEVDWNRPGRLFAGACSGIYRSLDGGGAWASLERAVGARLRTYVVAQAPRSANVVFAGTSDGLLQSPDGGATWRRLSPGSARSIAFDPADPRRMFVATDQGILRSEDGGSHFMEANRGLHSRFGLTDSAASPTAARTAKRIGKSRSFGSDSVKKTILPMRSSSRLMELYEKSLGTTH